MYLYRHMEMALRKAVKQSKVVLLTGARQVGKSTSIREIFPEFEYITLDDENDLRLAIEDKPLFFRDRRFPVVIDEIQYARGLMRTVKQIVDKSTQKGQVIMTGSQSYELLSEASESLAGRICVLKMSGLSCRELCAVDYHEPFLPTTEYRIERGKKIRPYDDLWGKIHRGMMPELLDPERDWEWYYRDYVRTYLERDVRRIINVRDEMKFRSFLVAAAGRSGQLLVYEDLAKDVGVDVHTIKSWLSVLAASGLVYIVHPYFNNHVKRMIKTPKIYMMDSGLLCYLLGWNSPETAKRGAMSGEIFESFVVSEILKSYMNAGHGTEKIYYYRDKEKREIDLVIEEGRRLYPIEIKKGATVSRDWIKNFSALERIPDCEIGEGAVICQAEKAVPISENVYALPIEYI